ncbi:MAG: alcohol dehydrogenase, partial [Pseudomonadota bacterium]|nr:alcohol dehydrogenase [Pseudomonadota bacterium]
MTAKTMRAARLHRFGEAMVVDQIPVPQVRSTDVRVKVQACNIVPNLHNILANWQVWN